MRSMISRTSKCRIVLCVLTTSDFAGASFLIRSEGSGGWATGMAMDQGEVFVVGTTFAKDFWDTTGSGTGSDIIDSDHECFLAIGSPGNAGNDDYFTRTRLSIPQVCVGGTTTTTTIGVSEEEETGSSWALVAGPSFDLRDPHTTTNSNGIFAMRYEDNLPVSNAKSHSLPTNTVPVAMARSADTSSSMVYMGLHDTNGQSLTSGAKDDKEALSNLLSFWSKLTNPEEQEALDVRPPDSPQIVQVNLQTGRVSLLMNLLATEDISVSTHITALFHSVQKDGETVLIVAGNTNCQWGCNFVKDGTSSGMPILGDWDGFVAWVDPATGQLRESMRIATPNHKRDHVHDICVFGDDLYIVGTTYGILERNNDDMTTDLSGGTFVLKIGLSTRSIYWQTQLPGRESDGKRCAVSEDAFYLAGTTATGSIDLNISSMDAFVVRLDPDSGDLEWTQQLDTSFLLGDDRMEEVVSLEVHAQSGDIHLLINAMNLEKGENEVILMDLDATSGANTLLGPQRISAEIGNFALLLISITVGLFSFLIAAIARVCNRWRQAKEEAFPCRNSNGSPPQSSFDVLADKSLETSIVFYRNDGEYQDTPIAPIIVEGSVEENGGGEQIEPTQTEDNATIGELV